MWHKPCRTFHPWCPCIKTRCLLCLWVQPCAPDGPMTMTCISTDQGGSNEFDLEWIHPVVAEFRCLQDSKSPYYERTDGRTNRQTNGQRAFNSPLLSFKRVGDKNEYIYINNALSKNIGTQIAKFMGPTWGPPGSYRTQMDPMLAPWTLLSG